MKTRAVGETRKYIQKNCDNKGNIKQSNITPEVRSGIRSLQRRQGEGELMVQLTDKSGETAVISVPRYIESMQPHVAGNPEVSWEEKVSLEKTLK